MSVDQDELYGDWLKAFELREKRRALYEAALNGWGEKHFITIRAAEELAKAVKEYDEVCSKL